jgi:hypothetical protein
MTISKDLFLAILSMDAYNRGYGAGLNLSGTSIGNASISQTSSIIKITVTVHSIYVPRPQ